MEKATVKLTAQQIEALLSAIDGDLEDADQVALRAAREALIAGMRQL